MRWPRKGRIVVRQLDGESFLGVLNGAYKFLKKDLPLRAIVRLERMRLFPLLLLAAALAAAVLAAASEARLAAKTDGAEYLQLQDGHGFASIRIRGNFFGRVHRGKVIATSNVSENGCEAHKRLKHGFWKCRGRDITFRTPQDTRWRVRLRGHGISATGFVKGCLRLDARTSGSKGSFKIGFFADSRSWPRSLRKYRLGTGAC
jgi:hypothetical protein